MYVIYVNINVQIYITATVLKYDINCIYRQADGNCEKAPNSMMLIVFFLINKAIFYFA